MTHCCFLSSRILSFGLLVFSGFSAAVAAEQNDRGVSFSRQVTFELTYANQDMIWLGDPASPTASAYPKPRARPIATDLCVSTAVEDREPRGRRFFREARITVENGVRKVYAFTSKREKMIGVVDAQGRFLPDDFYRDNRELLPSWPVDASILSFDDQENSLYYNIVIPGPELSESLDFLPLKLSDADDNAVEGRFSIDFVPLDDSRDVKNLAEVVLTLQNDGKTITLATATVPKVFRGADLQIGSFDNSSGTYLPEAAYRAGAKNKENVEPSVTVSVSGEFSPSIRSDAKSLILVNAVGRSAKRNDVAKITIDGNFDDWRNVTGVDDARGDLVPYLEYVPDVDLLEFKVSHDEQHIYLYARVAGQVGRSHPNGGRSYFYAYIDVDRNPGTGFLPTRDDDCYFGVDLGDDCEVQFEFVNNTFRKTFYGFCGLGGNENVLKQEVTIGKSQYGRLDANGVERANYKAEYIFREGISEITEDLKLGTSDTIRLAVSPDGREVEVISTFTGFLKNSKGRPTVQLGQSIDLAVGMECDSKAYLGKKNWAADNTATIRGYQLVDPN